MLTKNFSIDLLLQPMIVSNVLTHVFIKASDANNIGADDETIFETEQEDRFRAHLFGGAVFLGLLVIFWVPYIGFKIVVSSFRFENDFNVWMKNCSNPFFSSSFHRDVRRCETLLTLTMFSTLLEDLKTSWSGL